ncbi:probable transporter [Photobacterium sp. SKA34]|uniref:MFS transporter n=1 Tax=Photobacterium sp. SKA34 TaxID=121723 RepID=UPI00006BA374|nr:MFS transporter [Photobacterium sp. SKA34]EAR56758.1 probable transporter [Photobacterium sp. SKA34]
MNTSLSSNRLTGLTLLIAIAFFMEQLDSTIAVTAINNIANDLSVHSTTITMAIAVYIMTLAIFLPIGGWSAKNFGCKNTFLFAIILFTIGSFGCGFSNNIYLFLSSEVVQGIGAALMVPVGRLFVIQNSKKSELAKRISILVWPGLIAPIFGPSLGAYITTYYSWHWIFFINIPIAIILFFLAWYFLPTENINKQSRIKLDSLGFLLSSLMLVMGLGSLDWLSNFGINRIIPWALLTSSIIFGTLLNNHISKSESPIFSLAPWKNDKNFKHTLISGSICRAALSGLPILIPLFLQSELGLSMIESGNIILTMFAGNLLMKTFTTSIITKCGFKKPLIISSLISTLSILGCWYGQHNILFICVMLFLIGCMRSLQFSLYNTLAFSELPKPFLNSANVLNNLFTQISFAIGITLVSIFIRLGSNSNVVSSSHISILPFLGFALLALLPLMFLCFIHKDYGNSVR